jgi:hypothetical protein
MNWGQATVENLKYLNLIHVKRYKKDETILFW